MDQEIIRYLYEGLLSTALLSQYEPKGQPYAQYYHGANGVVTRKQFGLHGLVNPSKEPSMELARGLKYYLDDLRGTVAAPATPKGEIAEQYRYDAFGGLFTGLTAPYNTTALTGHQYDPTAGLVDMKACYVRTVLSEQVVCRLP